LLPDLSFPFASPRLDIPFREEGVVWPWRDRLEDSSAAAAAAASGESPACYETMREDSNKKSKVSWSKSLVRKWFNIKNKAHDFHADYDATPQTQGRDGGERRTSCSSERDAAGGAAKKSRTERPLKRNVDRVRR